MNDKNKMNSENTMNGNKEASEKKKKTPKQIAALSCVIILLALYLITFIVAFLDFEGSGKLFSICMISTIGLPVLCWLFLWFSGILKERKEENEKQFEEKD